MSDLFTQGLDEELTAEEIGIDSPKEEKMKRKPYSTWNTGAKEFKLKLTASAISKIEEKYRKNLLVLIMDDGLPPVSTMLTVIQASMLKFHHGMTFIKVQDAYDEYVDNGGDQTKLFSEVIMPLLGVSGFFSQNQMEILTEEMKDADSPM